jgi:hypothetical protein
VREAGLFVALPLAFCQVKGMNFTARTDVQPPNIAIGIDIGIDGRTR